MRHQRTDDRTRQLHKVKWMITIVFIITVFLVTGLLIYGKYYSQSAKRGMAIASGIYFTANYAGEVTDEDAPITESVVTSNYAGTSYSYSFEVRNYENNLLFNTDDMDIPYDISFWLDASPEEGVTYEVMVEEDSDTTQGLNGSRKDNPVTFSNQMISGGSAVRNNYKINIVVPENVATHSPLPIYVKVKTQNGAIINKTLLGKMVLNTAAITDNFVQTSGFKLPSSVTEKDDFNTIIKPIFKKSAGLTYELQTVGRVLNSDKATKTIRIAWDPDKLDIDHYDGNYLTWLSENSKSEPGTLTEADIAGDTDAKEQVGWKYFTISVMPYSSEQMIFYQQKGMNWDIVTEKSILDGYVSARDITAQ